MILILKHRIFLINYLKSSQQHIFFSTATLYTVLHINKPSFFTVVFFKMFKKLVLNFFPIVKCNLETVKNYNLAKSHSCVRYYATARRFYKRANVVYSGGKFEITLDQRKLKTPKGNLFYVESEPLALAVAAEWDAQKTYIIPNKMHLFGLCNTVLDNPNKLSKEDIVQKIIKYLDTDTVLYFNSEEDELYDLQVSEWLPIIDWFSEKFKVQIQPSKNISGPIISSKDKELLMKHLLSYNFWAIQGLSFAIEALKSVILGLSCVERHTSVEKTCILSRLEEEYQGKRWGRIEWSHELNQQDIQARVSAGILFTYANSSSFEIKNKGTVLEWILK